MSLAVTSMLLSLLASAQTQPPGLRIVVVEGEGANNALQHRAKDPVVRVVDENDGPVTGASVTFMLPDSGAFGGGVRTLTLLSDEKGEAVGRLGAGSPFSSTA